jgi:hypothetical protein
VFGVGGYTRRIQPLHAGSLSERALTLLEEREGLGHVARLGGTALYIFAAAYPQTPTLVCVAAVRRSNRRQSPS